MTFCTTLRGRGMDSNFQFRDAPPTAWAPSFGGKWAPRAAENRSIRLRWALRGSV